MSDRGEFEKRNPVPEGAIWCDRKQGYYCVSSASVTHPFNDMWECFCDGWQAAREQGGEAVANLRAAKAIKAAYEEGFDDGMQMHRSDFDECWAASQAKIAYDALLSATPPERGADDHE